MTALKSASLDVQAGGVASTRSAAPARRRMPRVDPQSISLLAAIALLVAFVGAQEPDFFRPSNLVAIGVAVSLLGLTALPQTALVIAGGLDISIGAIVGLASVACAKAASSGSALTAIVVALSVGAAAGFLNAAIIRWGRVNPIIATLATYSAFQGVTFIVSNGNAVGVDSSFLLKLGSGKALGLPYPLLVLIVATIAFLVVLSYTDVGRRIYAIGGNVNAARLAGVRVSRYTLGLYALSGLIAGVAGVLLTARTGAGLPDSGAADLGLSSITAVLLGGCALSGGKGTITGTILGVILLGVLDNGLVLLDVEAYYQLVAKGALLVLAVMIQEWRNARAGRPGGLSKLVRQ